MKNPFTPAQDQAYEKAYQLLSEHFEHVLIVVNTEAQDNTDTATDIRWHGGKIPCIGLAEYAKARLIAQQGTPYTDGDEKAGPNEPPLT